MTLTFTTHQPAPWQMYEQRHLWLQGCVIPDFLYLVPFFLTRFFLHIHKGNE